MSDAKLPPGLSGDVSSGAAGRAPADEERADPPAVSDTRGGDEVLELTLALNADGTIRPLSQSGAPPVAVAAGGMAGGGRPLEDTVREMVQPLVRAWLDENLQPMVERLVREEIARGAGRSDPA